MNAWMSNENDYTTYLLSMPYNYVAMCAEHVIIALVTILQNKTTTTANSTIIIAAATAAANATDDVVVAFVYYFVGSNLSSLHSSLFFLILLASFSFPRSRCLHTTKSNEKVHVQGIDCECNMWMNKEREKEMNRITFIAKQRIN